MNKSAFGRAALKTSETVHYLLLLALFIGPVAAVGAGPRSEDTTFFRRYVLAPLVVFFVIFALGAFNILLASLIRKFFRT